MIFSIELKLEDKGRVATTNSTIAGPETTVITQTMQFAVTHLPEMVADLLEHPDWVTKPKEKKKK